VHLSQWVAVQDVHFALNLGYTVPAWKNEAGQVNITWINRLMNV
jgi:hypothetical protein